MLLTAEPYGIRAGGQPGQPGRQRRLPHVVGTLPWSPRLGGLSKRPCCFMYGFTDVDLDAKYALHCISETVTRLGLLNGLDRSPMPLRTGHPHAHGDNFVTLDTGHYALWSLATPALPQPLHGLQQLPQTAQRDKS